MYEFKQSSAKFKILIAWFNDCIFGLSGQIVTLMIAIVDPYRIVVYAQGHFAILLIASSRKTCNSQSLESCNQNPNYGSKIKTQYQRVSTRWLKIVHTISSLIP